VRSLLIAAFLAAAAPCLAAPVELPVDLPDGATWSIESKRVRLDERKDGPRRTETVSRYKATYHEAAEGGRLTLNSTGGFFLGELPGGLKPEGFELPLELEVDEAMTPTRLVNWPEVRALVYKMLEGQEPRVVEGMKSLFDRMSDADAAPMFFPYMSYLGLGQGLALEVGKPLTYEDALPNPLGGPTIKANSVMTLESHDPKARLATVVWTQALDRDSMAQSMRVSVKVLFERMQVPNDPAKLEAAMKDMAMSRNSRCSFVIDEDSGLARTAECSQELRISGQGQDVRRTDTWTITQTLPEKR